MNASPSCDGGNTIKCPACDGQGRKYFVPVLGFWESGCDECYGLGIVNKETDWKSGSLRDRG